MQAERARRAVLPLFVALTVWIGCGGDDSVTGLFAAPADGDDALDDRVARLFPEFFPEGVPHSIALGSIVHGGPAKDGIPALTRPTVIPAAAADYLDPGDIVLGLEMNGVARAYPLRIMNWHEIVNASLGGVPVAVTYCPLCGTGIAFDPILDGKALEFGVSGLLHNSDLLMYDRDTDTPSLWQQALGTAVVGPRNETRLQILPLAHSRWDDWKAAHPASTVLSTDTGFGRNYSRDPYAGYNQDEGLFFAVDGEKRDLPRKTWVYGLIHNGAARAYPLDDIGANQALNDAVGGEAVLVVTGSGSPPSGRAYRRGELRFTLADGALTDASGGAWEITETALVGPDGSRLDRLSDGFVAFWFAWSTFYPNTDIYDGEEADPDLEPQRVEGLAPDRWGRIKGPDGGADG